MLASRRKHVRWSEELEKNSPPKINTPMKRVDGRGYIRISNPEYDGSKGYSYEHRLVVELLIGRELSSDECVHHINEIKTDNRLENLFLTTNSEHSVIHREGKPQSLNRRKNMRDKTRVRNMNRKRGADGRML